MSRPTLSLSASLRLTTALRERGENIASTVLRHWPVAKVRAAWLWIDLHDAARARTVASRVYTQVPLESFLESRRELPSCRVCGCTEDNACLDPWTKSPCSWLEPDLCSACRNRKEGPRGK